MSAGYMILKKVLNDKLGIIIWNDDNQDFSLNDYIYDSITFVEFIVAIEEEIDVELPDIFLNTDIFESFNGFAEMLDSYIKSEN